VLAGRCAQCSAQHALLSLLCSACSDACMSMPLAAVPSLDAMLLTILVAVAGSPGLPALFPADRYPACCPSPVPACLFAAWRRL
jgi:hypothetical protein